MECHEYTGASDYIFIPRRFVWWAFSEIVDILLLTGIIAQKVQAIAYSKQLQIVISQVVQERIYNSITAMGFSAMFTFQLEL